MTATKQWDLLNRLTSVTSAIGSSAMGYSYLHNTANQRTNVTLSDNSRWVYQYDSLGQVTSGKKYWSDGTPVAGQQYEYAFDDIGNRKTASSGGDNSGQNLRTAYYTNNILNQITGRTVPGSVQVLGSAASNATVTLWGDNGAYAPTARKGEYFRGEVLVTNNAAAVWLTLTNLAVLQQGTNADIVSSVTGSTLLPRSPEIFRYDSDGTLTNNGSWAITWDAENRATSFETLAALPPAAKQRIECAYDAAFRRSQKIVSAWNGSAYVPQSTNRFVYDGWNLVAILDSQSSILQSFVWGLDTSGSEQGAAGVGGLLATTIHTGPFTGTYFPAYDGNHNVVAYVRASDAQVVAQFEYGPFGEPIRATGPLAFISPFLLSTKYYDWETGFYCYPCRYYEPSTGRWLSRDRLGEAGGVNLYAFTDNTPIGSCDPLGLCTLGKFKKHSGKFALVIVDQGNTPERIAAVAQLAPLAAQTEVFEQFVAALGTAGGAAAAGVAGALEHAIGEVANVEGKPDVAAMARNALTLVKGLEHQLGVRPYTRIEYKVCVCGGIGHFFQNYWKDAAAEPWRPYRGDSDLGLGAFTDRLRAIKAGVAQGKQQLREWEDANAKNFEE
jgi:RHS repeat-associated protein